MDLKKAFLILQERFPSHFKIFKISKDEFEVKNIDDLPEKEFFITDDSRNVNENTIFFSTYYSKKFLKDAILKRPLTLFLTKNELQEILSDKQYQGYCIVGKKKPEFYLGHIASIYYNEPSKNMYIVAVTGTNGKTTTSFMIYHLWKKKGIPCAVIGTLGVYYWNGKEHHLETGFTTPRAYELHKILFILSREKIHHIAIEASSEALALRRLEGLNIQKAIFTTFGRDHLNFHQTLNHYFFSKLHLFFLTFRTTKNNISFIVVYDRNTYYHFHRFIKKTNSKIMFLLSSNLNHPFIKKQPMPLQFNQFNALCAYYGTYDNDIPLFDLNEAPLEDFQGVPGRVDRIKLNDNIDIIIDYAHTPDALQHLLSELKKEYLNIIVVFGCGGDRDKEKRPLMGEIAVNYSNYIVLTDDNPRSEDAQLILDDIKKGIPINKRIIVKEIGDRKSAIHFAINYALEYYEDKNTCVVIAGKGHENYQIIQNKKIPFSDKEVVLEFINEKTTR